MSIFDKTGQGDSITFGWRALELFTDRLEAVRLFNTYLNANNSFTYGLELTNRMPITGWWDMTANFNLFNSKINLDDPKVSSVNNQRTSWFAKLNNTVIAIFILALHPLISKAHSPMI